MKHVFAWILITAYCGLAWAADPLICPGRPLATGPIVESIPNENGGWSTLYDQNSPGCQGANHFADATNAQGQVTGRGCWQRFNDGYVIFVVEGSGAGEFIQLSRAGIAKIRAAHDVAAL